MNKYASAIASIIVMYVLPLAARSELLAHPRIIILIISSAALLLSQPMMSIREAMEKKVSDRFSMIVILFGAMIGQISATIEWAYFRPHVDVGFVTIIGGVMLVSGIAFRLWAISTLGKYFTSTVQFQQNQQVIQSGPYAIVRHPSYLGAAVAMIGSTLLMDTVIAPCIAAISIGYAYYYRVSAEEEGFVADPLMGDQYRIYQQLVRFRIIPLVW